MGWPKIPSANNIFYFKCSGAEGVLVRRIGSVMVFFTFQFVEMAIDILLKLEGLLVGKNFSSLWEGGDHISGVLTEEHVVIV